MSSFGSTATPCGTDSRQSPRGIRLTPPGSRSIIDPSAVRRSGADRKEPCMLLQLHLRLPALAVVLLLGLLAAG